MENTFVQNCLRIRIVRDETPMHPWAFLSQATHLVCWGDAAGISFGGEDIEERTPEIAAIQTADDLAAWQEQTKEPYYILGLRGDKYTFLETVDCCPALCSCCHGALVIDGSMYRKFVDSKFEGTDEELLKKMEYIARGKASELIAW